MKKSMAKIVRPRKLALKRESIASLSPPELIAVVGGSFSGWPPRCVSDVEDGR
jgi:hypothetical protein